MYPATSKHFFTTYVSQTMGLRAKNSASAKSSREDLGDAPRYSEMLRLGTALHSHSSRLLIYLFIAPVAVTCAQVSRYLSGNGFWRGQDLGVGMLVINLERRATSSSTDCLHEYGAFVEFIPCSLYLGHV
jgi:hypothetical protein